MIFERFRKCSKPGHGRLFEEQGSKSSAENSEGHNHLGNATGVFAEIYSSSSTVTDQSQTCIGNISELKKGRFDLTLK